MSSSEGRVASLDAERSRGSVELVFDLLVMAGARAGRSASLEGSSKATDFPIEMSDVSDRLWTCSVLTLVAGHYRVYLAGRSQLLQLDTCTVMISSNGAFDLLTAAHFITGDSKRSEVTKTRIASQCPRPDLVAL